MEAIANQIVKAITVLKLGNSIREMEAAEAWLVSWQRLGLGQETKLREASEYLGLLIDRRALLEYGQQEGVTPEDMLSVFREIQPTRLTQLFEEEQMHRFLAMRLEQAVREASIPQRSATMVWLTEYQQLFRSSEPLASHLAELRAVVTSPVTLSPAELQQRFFAVGSECDDLAAIEDVLEQLQRSGTAQSTRILGEWCRRRVSGALAAGNRELATRSLLIWKNLAGEGKRYLKFAEKLETMPKE